jgi:alkylhydroperoxidase family enzyme
VQAILADHRTAPIGEGLRATLTFLQTMTLRPAELGPGDVEPVRAAGVPDEALRDAVYVAWAFNLISRLADTIRAQPMSERMSHDELMAHEARFLAAGYAPSERRG